MNPEDLTNLYAAASAFGGAVAGVLGLRHQVKQLKEEAKQLRGELLRIKRRMHKAGIPEGEEEDAF